MSTELPPQYQKIDRDTVLISAKNNGGYTQDIFFGQKHHVVADEPEDVGGKDLGPSPFEFLQAALGTCTSMTLQMYAKRKDIEIETLNVTIHRIKEKNDDGQRIDTFQRIIDVSGPHITNEVKKRLVEIAEKCPVHKALLGQGRDDLKIYTDISGEMSGLG